MDNTGSITRPWTLPDTEPGNPYPYPEYDNAAEARRALHDLAPELAEAILAWGDPANCDYPLWVIDRLRACCARLGEIGADRVE